jgi:hypothetical protein
MIVTPQRKTRSGAFPIKYIDLKNFPGNSYQEVSERAQQLRMHYQSPDYSGGGPLDYSKGILRGYVLRNALERF